MAQRNCTYELYNRCVIPTCYRKARSCSRAELMSVGVVLENSDDARPDLLENNNP